MNKHQHRQSAVADFMQSLEQLDELWGNAEAEPENGFLDDGGQAGVDKTEHRSPSSDYLNSEHLNQKSAQPEAAERQP